MGARKGLARLQTQHQILGLDPIQPDLVREQRKRQHAGEPVRVLQPTAAGIAAARCSRCRNTARSASTSCSVILPANSLRHSRKPACACSAQRKNVCTPSRPCRYTVSLVNAAPPPSGTPRNTRCAEAKLSASVCPASRKKRNTSMKSAPSERHVDRDDAQADALHALDVDRAR